MFRALLAFVFVLTATSGFSQTNSEAASLVPGASQALPTSPKLVKDSVAAADSVRARKARRKSVAKAKAAAADSSKAAKAIQDSLKAAPKISGNGAPVQDSAKAGITGAANPPASAASPTPGVAAPAATPGDTSVRVRGDSGKAMAHADTAKASAKVSEAMDTVSPVVVEQKPVEIKRELQNLSLFNDPQLIGKEYGAGILGSLVAGALGFYIGSGIETAIQGEENAHKGTLKFTGIRYDNFKGAFWGGASGMVLGSALTTYFIGQTDEEDGGLFLTLLGTAAAGAGAFYIAHLAGVNDDIDWTPFIPLLAIPSMGGTLGFNVSRWFEDRKREKVVGQESAVRLHAPALAWGRTEGVDRLEVHALNLTF